MEPRVLVVDDEPSLRANLTAYLEDEDMDVTAAESGEEALELVAGGKVFDVCVMDIRLPGISGEEAIVRLHAQCPHLLFLVHTGTANYSLPKRLHDLGLTDQQVFTKPLADMWSLAETIQSLADAGHYPHQP